MTSRIFHQKAKKPENKNKQGKTPPGKDHHLRGCDPYQGRYESTMKEKTTPLADDLRPEEN
jgi:hypothetical protein